MSGALKRLLSILLLATSLILLAAFGRTCLLRLEAQHWRRQIAAASDGDAIVLIRSTPWEDDSQRLSLLVESLVSPRDCVREAAEQKLRETLRHWQTLAPQEQSGRFADLAAAIVDQSKNFDSRACREAKALIVQVLQQPSAGCLAERGRTIALCQRVLAAVGDRDRTVCLAQPVPSADTLADPEATGAGLRARQEPLPPIPAIDGFSQLPGGAIPVESFSLPQLPALPPKETADARSEPAALPVPARPHPLAAQPTANAGGGDAPATSASTKSWLQSPHNDHVLRATSLAEFRCRAGITPAVAVTGLEQSETIDLIRDLSSTDPTIEAKARTELTQRGFTDFHLKFARRLFDPDPAVRREVAQMLPSLPGMDSAPWLLYLCRDDDPDVRLTAVSLIVTTGNPALIERAEAIARADSDPRMQNQAEQIAQFRRQNASGGVFR